MTTSLSIAGHPARDSARIAKRIERLRWAHRNPQPLQLQPASAAMPPDTRAGVPEIESRQLSSALLEAALASQGCLIVRNMLQPNTVEQWRNVIDNVIDSSARAYLAPEAAEAPAPCPDPYYDPPAILNEVLTTLDLEVSRRFHRESGSTMCAEAPIVAEALLALYDALGLRPVIANYLREPPCLSVKKWVLRKSKLPIAEAGWHQDGAFMGTDIRSINLWLPLTRCGGSTGAPGLDIVPRRLEHIIRDHSAAFDWSVSTAHIDSHLADTPAISPEFNAGDGFFFDHYFLHRTQYGEQFDTTRYAIETWFFGERSFPRNQVPLEW